MQLHQFRMIKCLILYQSIGTQSVCAVQPERLIKHRPNERAKIKDSIEEMTDFLFHRKCNHILHNNFSSSKYVSLYRIPSVEEMFEKKFYRLKLVEFFYGWCCAMDVKIKTKTKQKSCLICWVTTDRDNFSWTVTKNNHKSFHLNYSFSYMQTTETLYLLISIFRTFYQKKNIYFTIYLVFDSKTCLEKR